MKKYLKTVLALVLALVMMVPGALTTAKAADKLSDEVTILYTNDVHTYIDKTLSYDNVAGLKKSMIKAGKAVLLVDAGDAIQGTAFGGMDQGKHIVKIMEEAGYDLATLGNHEFDYAMARALEVATTGKVPYVSCNFMDLATGKSVVPGYKIFEKNGAKIAFVGITTPEAFVKSTPKYFQNKKGEFIYGLCQDETGKELYDQVQATIDEAKKAGADFVIGLGHLGDDPTSSPWTSAEVIQNTTGFDAFIDGHSHSTVEQLEVKDKDGNAVVLSQTGQYFSKIGQMTIAKDGTITTKLVETTVSDPGVRSLVEEWTNEVDTQLGEVIGYTEVQLDINDADGQRLIRKQETNLGDFCADAIYYLFDQTEGLKVDIAIMNGGGIRAAVPEGEITYKTCKTVHTFGNVMCLMTIKGQAILDALEWGAKDVGVGENGGFLHCAGVTFNIDPSVPANVLKDETGTWIGNAGGAYRVSNVKLYNKETGKYEALDVNKDYNIAGTNYTLRDCGDGFGMFGESVLVKDYVMEDYLALANYVKSFAKKNGVATITSNDYGTVKGYITVGAAASTAPAKVKFKKTAVASNAAGQAKVSYKKTALATGYEIVYATKKDFSNAKKVNTTKLSKTLKNLKSGKTYYVKVRAFNKAEDGTKTYGDFSAVKKIKVK